MLKMLKFQDLNRWEKIGVWGSVASLIGLILAIFAALASTPPQDNSEEPPIDFLEARRAEGLERGEPEISQPTVQSPPPEPPPMSALECKLTTVQRRCTLGDTGLRVFINFYDQPTRAKIELSGTASGAVSGATILAGGSCTLHIENRQGKFYLLDIAYREQLKTVEVTLGESLR